MIRPRYAIGSGQPAGNGETRICCEVTSVSSSKTPRGGWRQRATTEQSGTWEVRPNESQLNEWQESIIAFRFGRKSARLIVVMKPGNAGGAKGPYGSYVFGNDSGEPLGDETHYGRRVNSSRPAG